MILNSKLTYSSMHVNVSGGSVKGKGKVADGKVDFGSAPVNIFGKMSSQMYQALSSKYDRLGDVISSLTQQRKEIDDLLQLAGGSSA